MWCSVCFGDPNSDLVLGYNYGIAVMLVVVGIVLSCFAGLFLSIRNRIKKVSSFKPRVKRENQC